MPAKAAAPTNSAIRAPSSPVCPETASSIACAGCTVAYTSDAGLAPASAAPNTLSDDPASHAHSPTTPASTPTHATVLVTLESVPRLLSDASSPSITTNATNGITRIAATTPASGSTTGTVIGAVEWAVFT